MEQITNVNVTDIEDGQVLAWDVATSKWLNITISSSTTPNFQEVTDVGANTTNAISTGGVGINTTTPEAIFDAVSTSSGILIPRMTTSQRNAISSPVNSMLIYNSTTASFEYYKDAAWISFLDAIPTLQQVLDTNAFAIDVGINLDYTELGVTYGSEWGPDHIGITREESGNQLSSDLNENRLFFNDTENLLSSEYRIDKIIHNGVEYLLPTGEESQIDKLSIIVSANKTAENDTKYTVIANATFTDPTPVEGKGYTVFVRNGTATIGGVGYTAGSLVYRFYYSGAWSSTSIGGTVPDADASTKGIAKLYTDLLASNTDGSVTQSALVTEFNLKDVLPVIYEKHANVPIFGSASLNNLEGVTFAVTGGTARTFSDTSIYTRRQRLGLVTTTTGNPAQMRQTVAYFNRNSNLLFIIGLGFAENCTNPNVRAFAGVCANLGVFGNTEPTALLNCIGLAKLTTSNNLHVIHNDGSGTATAIDLGATFPTNTVETDFYILIGETNGSNINYTVNRVNTGGVATGTITTDLPSPSTALNLGYYVVQNTGANTNTGIDFFGTNLIKQ